MPTLSALVPSGKSSDGQSGNSPLMPPKSASSPAKGSPTGTKKNGGGGRNIIPKPPKLPKAAAKKKAAAKEKPPKKSVRIQVEEQVKEETQPEAGMLPILSFKSRSCIVSFSSRADGHTGSIEVPMHDVSPGKSDKEEFLKCVVGTEVFSAGRIMVASQLAVLMGTRGQIALGPAKHQSDDLNFVTCMKELEKPADQPEPWYHHITFGLDHHDRHDHMEKVMRCKIHDVKLVQKPASDVFAYLKDHGQASLWITHAAKAHAARAQSAGSKLQLVALQAFRKRRNLPDDQEAAALNKEDGSELTDSLKENADLTAAMGAIEEQPEQPQKETTVPIEKQPEQPQKETTVAIEEQPEQQQKETTTVAIQEEPEQQQNEAPGSTQRKKAEEAEVKLVWTWEPDSIVVKSGDMLKFSWPKCFQDLEVAEVVQVKEFQTDRRMTRVLSVAGDAIEAVMTSVMSAKFTKKTQRVVFHRKVDGREVHMISGAQFGYHQFEADGSQSSKRHIFQCMSDAAASGRYRPRLNVLLEAGNTHTGVKVFLVLLMVASLVMVYYGANAAADWVSSKVVIAKILDCESVPEYCNTLERLKNKLKDTSLTFFMIGIVFFAGWALYETLNSLWLLPPTLSSFGRGFDHEKVRVLRFFSGLFLIVPLVLVMLYWSSNILLISRMIEFIQVVQRMVDKIVDDMFAVIVGFDKLLDMLLKLRGINADLSAIHESIDQVMQYEGMARSYGQIGLEGMMFLLTVIVALTFWAMLIVIFSFSNAISGIIRRNPSQLRQSRDTGFLSLGILCFVLGFNQFFQGIASEFIGTYVDASGNIVMPENRTESGMVSMFVSCEDDTSNSFVPWEDMLKPINETIGDILTKTCVAGHCISFTVFTDFSKDAMHRSISVLIGEITSFGYWISDDDANVAEMGLTGLDRKTLAAGLGAALDILGVVSDMVQCKQSRPFIHEMVALLDIKLLPAMHAVSYTIGWLAATCTSWLVIATVCVHVIERPRKNWYDFVSKRWFIFRFSFLRVRQYRVQRGIEHYVPDRVDEHWCDIAKIKHKFFLKNMMMCVFFVVAGGMLCLTDTSKSPNGGLMQAGSIMLVIGATCGVVGSWNRFDKWYNRLLRLLSLLLKVVTFVLFTITSLGNARRIFSCRSKVDESGLDQPGPLMSNVASLVCQPPVTPATLCHVTVKQGVELEVGNRLALLPEANACQDGGALFVSEAATLFGRNYTFANGGSVPSGVYNMCWSQQGGSYLPTTYSRFSGLLYVNQDVDKFKTCSVEVVAGLFEALLLCVSLLPHLILVACTNLCSLGGKFYKMHVSDAMLRAVTHESGTYLKNNRKSAKIAGNLMVGMSKKRTLSQRYMANVRRYWSIILGLALTLLGLIIPMAAGWLHNSKVLQTYSEDAESVTTTRLPSATQSCANCCNLKESNCARTLDKVIFATSHNAMSSRQEQWLQPNNVHDVELALKAGIRALMLDLYYRWPADATEAEKEKPTQVHLCHGFCSIGFSLLNDTLATIKRFLDANENELVVLILEQYVASSSVVEELEAAGLKKYLGYTHTSASTAWPTMSTLLAQGHRLLVVSRRLPTFAGEPEIPTANLQPTYAAMSAGISGWHHAGALITESPYAYNTLDDMQNDCSVKLGMPSDGVAALSQSAPQGSEQHRLVILNHFVSNPTPCQTCAEEANKAQVLEARHALCQAAWKHQVNFIAVDFWSIGDITAVVNTLNS